MRRETRAVNGGEGMRRETRDVNGGEGMRREARDVNGCERTGFASHVSRLMPLTFMSLVSRLTPFSLTPSPSALLLTLSLFVAGLSQAADHRPETWFHLIGGNVSKAGLTADLEAVKAAGISGIQLFHGQMGQNLTWPGVTDPIPCLSAQWDDLIAFAASECKRLGLGFKMQNCPGWSMSGGPWVKPENAMRVLTCARTELTAAGQVKLSVPAQATDRPADRDYRDLFVLAFPTPKDDTDAWLKPAKVESPAPDVRVFTFARPVTVRTVEMNSSSAMNHARSYDPAAEVSVYALGDNGSETLVTRQEIPPGNWQDNRPLGTRQTFALDEAVARRWKLVMKHVDPVNLGNVTLSSAARLNQWQGLAGWTLRGLVDRGTPKQDRACWIDTSALVNLTGRMSADGTLDWTPPRPGSWTVLRIGHVNGLCKNGPAPAEATGWECSKLSKKGIEAVYANYIGRLAKGPAKGLLQGLVVDSWECFRQNWTEGLDKIFATRCGYDPLPLLPAVFGWVTDDPAQTEKFLRDWRGLLGSLVEENYYGHLAELAHADGLTVQYETAFGDALAGDLLKFWKYADTPMCEFWRPTEPTGVGSADFKPVKPCVSAAHVYGFRRVAAEALTNCALTWDEKLADFKPVLDRHYARGVTHMVFQTYTHNPQVGFKKPGTSFGYFIGTPFLRGQDWWPYMPLFTGYIARCGEFLEAGLPVVDVLRVLGDALGHKPSERTEHFGNRFKDDYVNKDALLTRTAVRDGRIVFPNGVSYTVLWVPDGTYLDAESVARLAALEQAGAKVVRGGDPTVGLTPDVVSPDGRLMWYHRLVDGEDRYFVAACDAPCRGRVTFRGRAVELDLAQGESRFVTFAKSGVRIIDPVTGQPPEVFPSTGKAQVVPCAADAKGLTARFTVRRGERAYVDLGAVDGVAEIRVNGKLVATRWCAPYRCNVTEATKEGENTLDVRVAVSWYNRLRLDQAKPEEARSTWTLYAPKADAKPLPEGLQGPVRVLTTDAVRAD